MYVAVPGWRARAARFVAFLSSHITEQRKEEEEHVWMNLGVRPCGTGAAGQSFCGDAQMRGSMCARASGIDLVGWAWLGWQARWCGGWYCCAMPGHGVRGVLHVLLSYLLRYHPWPGRVYFQSAMLGLQHGTHSLSMESEVVKYKLILW